MEESTKIKIVHVINETKSEIKVQKKSNSGFCQRIIVGDREEVNTDFFDIIFEFPAGQRVFFDFVKHEKNGGIDPHIDVKVGHPDNKLNGGD